MALQEVADLSRERAEVLISAVAALAEIDLVFLGGNQWTHRTKLRNSAVKLGITDRVHFVGDVPSSRRIDYLSQADIGLALADGGVRRGSLPAVDVFDMLGVPFVAADGQLDGGFEHGIEWTGRPAALQEAVLKASERGRMPAREDGDRVLETLILELAGADRGGRVSTPTVEAGSPVLASEPVEAAADESAIDLLLSRAKLLRDRGERGAALELYTQAAVEAQAPTAIAVAAAGLARLGAQGESWAAIGRVLEVDRRPALATVRAGEAAAILGDLVKARACAEEVVADDGAPVAARRGAARVLEQAGEPRAALGVAREISDEPAIARIEGTLKSYDPSWLPVGRGERALLRLRPGHSLALLETSLPHVRSGYTYRAQTLLRAQRQVGIEPAVLTRLGFPATRGLTAPPREEVDGVVHHRAGLPGVQRYTSVPISEQLETNMRWAADIARQVAPEGIVATTPHLNGLVGLALRRKLGVPMIYDVRGFPEMTWAVRRGGGDTEVHGLRRIVETRCMREADLVTTLSETMRRQIIGRGVAADRVFVLPHAVDTREFAPAERDRELAARLGLSNRNVVGYISSLVAYEGVETLLEALAFLRYEDPSIAGLIVGDGALLPALKARAARLGLDDGVVFTGRIDASEIARYYSLMDLFVCPRHDHEVTRYVTPLKPFEAMAAGRCLVVSDLPALREAVRDGECGSIFPAGDPEALAQTIGTLIDQPERRRRLAAAAREHVVAKHSFGVLCKQLERVWAELKLRGRDG